MRLDATNEDLGSKDERACSLDNSIKIVMVIKCAKYGDRIIGLLEVRHSKL